MPDLEFTSVIEARKEAEYLPDRSLSASSIIGMSSVGDVTSTVSELDGSLGGVTALGFESGVGNVSWKGSGGLEWLRWGSSGVSKCCWKGCACLAARFRSR